MNPAIVCALILGLAVLIGSARYLYSVWRSEALLRPRAARVISILLLQALSALLLYLLLFPPVSYTSAERLVILTANANPADNSVAGRLLALPEAPDNIKAERIPDLASALRRYPGVNQLHIIGAGLGTRDQFAASGLSVSFSPSPLPAGIVELWLPEKITVGSRWQIHGRVTQKNTVRIELLDPGNNLAASTQSNTQGSFALTDTARAAGLAMYHIRVIDDDKKIIDNIDVPIHVIQDKSLRVLVLSGGPNPELKYLRRWASDAGIKLDSQVQLSAGMQMNTSVVAINANNLRALDLLILDERAWSTMSRGSKQLVIDALRDGLGVLLRITGPVSANTRNELRALGFAINDANLVQRIHLTLDDDKKTQASLTRRPLQVNSRDGVVLFQDDANNPLALWRAEGRGRIALWWLTDSYQLVLNSHASMHGQIWGDAVSTVSRPRDAWKPTMFDPHPRVDERVLFCDIVAKTYVQTTDNSIHYLLPEKQPKGKNCAGYWPQTSGWQILISGESETPFYVRSAKEALGLKANAINEATQLLAAKHSADKTTASIPAPGSPWPWFFAWLIVTALLWCLERSRLGIR
jgi:hypothetical protein